MNKIGIDARFYGPKGKGLGRYCQKLIELLEKVDGGSREREYHVFLKKENFDLYHPCHKNFQKHEADFGWYSFAEQLKFPAFLNSFNLDLVHFCHFNVPLFYRGKFVVTIHDLILLHHPTLRNTTINKAYYILKLFAYQITIRSALRRAKKVLAVSNFTKQDLLKEFKLDKNKLITTYEGCDFYFDGNSDNDEEILQNYGIIKPYLIYVGNAYPHKNLERLVVAFKNIKKVHPGISLVLVGGSDYFYQRLQKFVKSQSIQGVIFPGYVPDNSLQALYRNAQLYVFPSLYEGFGLPPLEALSLGTPVASSSKTSMPEVLGNAATYFDPENTDSISETINNLLNKQKSKIFSPELAKKQIQKFSWKNMARETLRVYEECLKSIN